MHVSDLLSRLGIEDTEDARSRLNISLNRLTKRGVTFVRTGKRRYDLLERTTTRKINLLKR